MLTLRLTRTGKTHQPHYRIVVQEKRSKLNGAAIDTIGHYHPAQKEKAVTIDADKARAWLAKGAQPSDTVTNILVKAGVLDKSKAVHNFYTPAPKVEEVKEEPKAEAPVTEETEATEEAQETEAPAEEATEETPDQTETPEATPDETTPENVEEEQA